MQTYYGMNDINLEKYFEKIFTNSNEFMFENNDINEEDHVWIGTHMNDTMYKSLFVASSTAAYV